MDLPKRKQIRLREYDYSSSGAYFVTICTHDRRCILSDIAVGEGLVPLPRSRWRPLARSWKNRYRRSRRGIRQLG